MTECITSKPKLKRVERRQVAVDFNGGTLTSDGGLLLLREVDQRLDLLRQASEIIPDPRAAELIVHSQQELLTSRVFGIAARVRVSCRRVLFQLASSCPQAELFKHILVRLCRSG